MNHSLKPLQFLSSKFKSILTISDPHYPFNHPDIHVFLQALAEKYKPDLVVCMGDEVDNHAISFHDKDPDLFSPSQELDLAIDALQPLYKLFKNMVILDSNHGSLVYRKGKNLGLPSRVFRSWKDIIEAPRGWQWCSKLLVHTEMGPVHFEHGRTAAAGKLSKDVSCNAVQGHYHSKFQASYWGNSLGLHWDMHVGCLVDDNSLAMAYNKITLDRPVIGTGVILNGRPLLIPMVLDRRGRWVQRL